MAEVASTTTLNASCLCGSVKYTVSVPNSFPLPAHLCHCSVCRRTHGILCGLHFHLPSPPSFVLPSSLEGMVAYQSSNRCTRYFCPTCGAHMLDYGPKWTGSMSVFENAEGLFDLRKHLFVSSTQDGGVSNWIKNFGGHEVIVSTETGDDDASGQTFVSSSTTSGHKDLLHAHCRCGGVEFYISRPDNSTLADSTLRKWIAPNFNNKWRGSCCVCRSCRLTTGGSIIPFIFVPNAHIKIFGADNELVPMPDDLLIGTSKIYKSSEDVRRTFCGRCGAFVFYAVDERPEVVDIGAGLLDAPNGALALDWVEWRTGIVSHINDGVAYDRQMADSLVEGLKEWGAEEYGAVGNWLLGQ